jgi:hypothetical protein
MKMKKYTKWSVMSVLWLVNPIYFVGCSEEYEFTFGQEDMLVLVDEFNDDVWVYEGEEQTFEIKFTLEQQEGETASLNIGEIFSSAHACEQRSFLAEAAACVTNTDLPLEGVATILDYETKEVIQAEIAVTGSLSVTGYDLDNAQLDLFHDNGSFSFMDYDETEGIELVLESAAW